MMEHLIPGYTLNYVIPNKNKCGGVGIYSNECIDCVSVLDELSVKLTCGCCKCEIESLFVECSFRGTILLEVYIDIQNGRIAYFVHDLENSLSKIASDRRVVIVGDLNIDVIRFSENEDTLRLYVTTLLFYKYLPYITMPTRITSHSATCIDHNFAKTIQQMML